MTTIPLFALRISLFALRSSLFAHLEAHGLPGFDAEVGAEALGVVDEEFEPVAALDGCRRPKRVVKARRRSHHDALAARTDLASEGEKETKLGGRERKKNEGKGEKKKEKKRRKEVEQKAREYDGRKKPKKIDE